MSIHGRAAWDYIPNPPRRSPFFGGAEGGPGGLPVLVCTLPCAGGFAGGSSVRHGPENPVASRGLVGPFEEEPRIRRGGLRYLGGVCGTFGGTRGGYAVPFLGSRGGMPELLWAQGGVYRNFCGLKGG